jgi:hypothetical protein
MPSRRTIERAKEDEQDERQGKSASTQAGEFVREEIHHIREGKHGARSTEQAIAIALSKARRAGVRLPAPKPGLASEETRRRSQHELALRQRRRKISRKRSHAITEALEREGHSAASTGALATHAKAAARKRTATARSASARRAARTRSKHGRR